MNIICISMWSEIKTFYNTSRCVVHWSIRLKSSRTHVTDRVSSQKVVTARLLVHVQKQHTVWRLQECASCLQIITTSAEFILRLKRDAVRSYTLSWYLLSWSSQWAGKRDRTTVFSARKRHPDLKAPHSTSCDRYSEWLHHFFHSPPFLFHLLRWESE